MTASTGGGVQLEIDGLQLGAIGTNCYVVRAAGSSDAVVIDPGAEPDRIVGLAAERGLTIQGILVTHCHWDHICAVAPLAEATGAPVWMSETEAIALENPEQFAMGGMEQVPPGKVDHRLAGGERIELAGMTFDVLSVPGHSPGHLAFVTPGVRGGATGEEFTMPPVCFVGDVVFRGSVGRTDLPFADSATLNDSLRLLRDSLEPETVLLSGHGEPTNLATEVATNPFFRDL